VQLIYLPALILAPALLLAQAPSDYASPKCTPNGPAGASWACDVYGAPAPPPAPAIPAAGQVTTDPSTGNRVLRVTSDQNPNNGAQPEGASYWATAAGWMRVWNADSTRFLINGENGVTYIYNFDPKNMTLGGWITAPPGQWQFTNYDPNIIMGTGPNGSKGGNCLVSYNVATQQWDNRCIRDFTTIPGWPSGKGGTIMHLNHDWACMMTDSQDNGFGVGCFSLYNHDNTAYIDVLNGTINGQPFAANVRHASQGQGTGIHEITVSPDGWLAIDSHSPACPNSTAPAEFYVNLNTKQVYQPTEGCGSTHWALGFNGYLVQGGGAANACSQQDSRHESARYMNDSSNTWQQLNPCIEQNQNFNSNIHVTWQNNDDPKRPNGVPVIGLAFPDSSSQQYLSGEIFGYGVGAQAKQNNVYRFGQTWATPAGVPGSCAAALDYASAQVSNDGKWVLFYSDWQGQTGHNGRSEGGDFPCGSDSQGRHRMDAFIMELK
jgi:hypothetical protein